MEKSLKEEKQKIFNIEFYLNWSCDKWFVMLDFIILFQFYVADTILNNTATNCELNPEDLQILAKIEAQNRCNILMITIKSWMQLLLQPNKYVFVKYTIYVVKLNLYSFANCAIFCLKRAIFCLAEC